MPELDKIKPVLDQVQNDFVATITANPSLTDAELAQKFPEIGQLGIPVPQGLAYLKSYASDANSGKYGSLQELKGQYSAENFINQSTPSQTTTPVTKDPQTEMLDSVQNDFVATMDANGGNLTDEQIMEKFPEIQQSGIPSTQAIPYLRDYYADAKSGKYSSLEELKSDYALKKKDSTEQNLDQTGLQTSDQLEPSSSRELLPGSGQSQLDSSISGSDQLGSVLQGSITEGLPDQTAVLKKFPSTDSYIDDLIPKSQYTQVNDADTGSLMININTGRPFGSNEEIFIDPRIKSQLQQDIVIKTGAQIDKEAEVSLEQKISSITGLPMEVIQEKKGEWALKSKIADSAPGLSEDDLAARDRIADKYVRDQANQIQSKNFDEVSQQLGPEQTAEYWKKKSNEIGMSYLSENDLAIYDLKQKIEQLESVEERTPQQEMELKKLKSSLDTAVELKLTGKDLFTEDGSFILNKKVQIEDQAQFTDKVNKYAAIYDGTDKSALTKERDNAFFQYVYAKKQYEQSVAEFESVEGTYMAPKSAGETGFEHVDAARINMMKHEQFMEDRLAYFMGVNRALLLNSDPGTESEDTFGTGVVEGFKSATNIISNSESALADRAIQGIQNAGFETTDDQEAKIGADFWEKAGTAVGQSIPVSVEIGLNIWLGNKAAGISGIPRLAQALANGNKMKQFGLTILYESALQGTAFAVSGESFSSGIGEGIGQTIGTALLSRFGVSNKLLNFGVRTATGAITETAAEYSGQFLDELESSGFDWKKASEETFGKTPEDAWEKLAITYMVALTMGVGGGSQESNLFLKEAQSELRESGSDSPIVEEAIKMDVTQPATDEEISKKEEIIEKKEAGEDISDAELQEAELVSSKEDFQKNEQVEKIEASPVIVVNKEGETEYTFQEGESSGFVSEEELMEKLDNNRFINKIKTGSILLNITNPSPEISAKIKEKFPDETQASVEADTPIEQPELRPETSAETILETPPGEQPVVEEQVTEKPVYESDVNKTETTSEAEATSEAGVLESELDNIERFSAEAEPNAGNLFNKNEAFDSLSKFSSQVAEETGLSGKKLAKEISSRLEQKFGKDSSILEDFSDVSNEVVSAIKITQSKSIIEKTDATSSKKIKQIKSSEEAIKYAEKNKEQLVDDYLTKHEKGLKGIIDLDAIRDSFKDVGYTGKNVPIFNAAGWTITDAIYDRLLKNSKNKTIAILSGVGGAGKTRAVRTDENLNIDDKGIVFDSAFNVFEDLDSVIKRAKDAGFDVEIVPVYNDIKTAFANTIDRGKRTGRFLSLSYYLDAFEKNEGKLLKLLEKHPDVKITAIDNTGNERKFVDSVTAANDWSYTPTDAEIIDILKSIKDDTELTESELSSIAGGIEGIKEHVEKWEGEVEGLVAGIKARIQVESGSGSGKENAGSNKRSKQRIPEVRVETGPTPGSQKINPENKRFSERLGKQTTLKDETKAEILKDSTNVVRDQKQLFADTKASFDKIMKETGDDYESVIRLADDPAVMPDYREMMYGHVMQHLEQLEKSTDPAISKAASNRLVELGNIIAERLNQSGKQIAAMATVYKNFPMYEFYQKIAVIEKLNERILKSTTMTNGDTATTESIKKEATRDIESVIKDIEDNFEDLFNDKRFEKVIQKLESKIDRKKRPVKMTAEKKKSISDKKKAALDRFFGRKGITQASLPGVQQVGAVIEYAAALIEEGYYRSQDIISEIREAFNSRGANLDDTQIKKILSDLKQFNEILKNEEVTTRKDSFSEIMIAAIDQYLRAGLKNANMTMDQALLASDADVKQIKSDLIESLKNNFNLTNEEAESAVTAIDQVFREKAIQKLKQRYGKFYKNPISVKKAQANKEIDKLTNDIALGAVDTTFEFLDMTFKKYGILDTNNPAFMKRLKEKATRVRNAAPGVLKDRRRRDLETFIHQARGAYGFKDWLITRFYADILSGPITHAKNLKYNTFAVGIAGPISQLITQGANPISTLKEMRKSFLEVDSKVTAHYLKTGDNFIDPSIGPKTYADQLEFNLIKNGYTKFLNLASTRLLVASDMALTRPFAAAVFKNHVKTWLNTEKGLKGRELEKAASELMGYTEENIKNSSKQAKADLVADYGFDPFTDNQPISIQKEATVLLLLRTQERILENSKIEEKIGTDAWLDVWNGESLQESSMAEAKNLALQGEVLGTVGIITDILDKIIDFAPVLKFKIPFTRIIGNLLNTGIKWTPGIGQLQAVLRYSVNKKLAAKGMPTTSSSLLHLLDKPNIEIINKMKLKNFNKGISYRQSKRDLTNALVVTGVQALIFALMAKDDEDEGLVITGMLDPSFFKRESVKKGTGITPWGLYWRNENGDLKFLSEYKNSAYGYALAFFGELNDITRLDEKSVTSAYLKALFASPFFSAEKPAVTGLKELWDDLSPVDQYGNNKYLDEKGYADKLPVGIATFMNSVFVANLFKQSNKLAEQVYGYDAKRAVNWQQALIKGLPFANQSLLEAQVDHFGRPIEQKFELGFLGAQGNLKNGFTTLEPNKIDPYYELYTDHGMTPNWFTSTEIPIYHQDEFGRWKTEKIEGSTENQKMRISKFEGHMLNAMIGSYRREFIDNYKQYDYVNGEMVVTSGKDALSELDNIEFKKEMQKIDSKAKEQALIDFFSQYKKDDVQVSNEKKTSEYLKATN